MSIILNSLSFDNPDSEDINPLSTDNYPGEDLDNIDYNMFADDENDIQDMFADWSTPEITSNTYTIKTIKDVRNRSQLLYETGLYEQPFNEKGELKSRQAIINLLFKDSVGFRNYTRQLQYFLPRELQDISADDIIKIISGISTNEASKDILNKFGYKDDIYLKSNNYVTDLIRRQAAYLKAIKTAGRKYPYKDYPTQQLKTIIDPSFVRRTNNNELPTIPTQPIHYNNNTEHLLEMDSFVGLLMLAENTQPKSGLDYEDDGLLQNLMIASIYSYILSYRLGRDAAQYNLDYCKMFSEISTETITDETAVRYINSIKYALYIWCIPTQNSILRFRSMYRYIRQHCKSSGQSIVNMDISHLRAATVFITDWSYAALVDACNIKEPKFVGQEASDLRKLTQAANESFASLLEFIYLNCFDVFANQIRRIYRDITIKTYEPATEFQLGGPGYFDDFKSTDSNEIINRIGGILNGNERYTQ